MANDKTIQFQPLFIRIFHWAHVVLIVIVVVTGLYISHPFLTELWTMRQIKLVHNIAAYLGLAVIIGWVYGSLAAGLQDVHRVDIHKLRNLGHLGRYYLFKTDTPPPPQPKYNIGAILVHLSWLILYIIASLLGIFLSFPDFFLPVARLLGGYKILRWVIYLITLYFASTIPLHIYLAMTEDPARLQAMITGQLRSNPPIPEQKPKPYKT